MVKVISLLAVFTSLYHLYTAAFGVFQPYLHRAFHVSLFLCLYYLSAAYKPKKPRSNTAKLVDTLAALLALTVYLYIWLNWPRFEGRYPYGDVVTAADFIIGVILVILVLECSRRLIGLTLVVMAFAFFLYAILGPYVPGLMRHKGFTIVQIIEQLYMAFGGIFGVTVGTSSSFIVLFVIFGSFLLKSGAADFLTDFANAFVGHTRGGPAKIAVLASALFGTISGAPTANVVGTGSFTIPLMKRIGYRPHFAAAVEAAASTGGSIMPPIMGSSSFLLAEITGIPYIQVAAASALPAIIYFLTVGAAVHFEACRLDLRGIPKSQIPRLRDSLKQAHHFIIPLVVIVGLIAKGFTLSRAGFIAVLAVLAVNMTKRKRMGLKTIFKALEDGANSSITVVSTCALAGMVIGIISLTGLGGKITGLALSLSGGRLFPTLVFSMLASLILGMGMTISAAYVLVAFLAAPAILQIGVPMLQAHLFVLYFSVFSVITPPVAVAAYAAASIADSPPMKVGWTAIKLALAAFIIPYTFIYNPALILRGSIVEIIVAFITAAMGAIFMAGGLQGWLLTSANWLERVCMIAGGVMMIIPGMFTDVIGLCIALCAAIMQTRRLGRSIFQLRPLKGRKVMR